MNNFIKQKNTKKRIIALSALLVIVLLLSGLYLYRSKNSNSELKTTMTDGLNNVNYDGPTEEEKQQADANKQRVTDRINLENNPPQQDGTRKQVEPVIVSWGFDNVTGDIDVSAIVPGVFEDGGECKLILTGGSASVSALKTGIKNVSDVSCGSIAIEKAKISSSKSWSAILEYTSSSALGSSKPVLIEVK